MNGSDEKASTPRPYDSRKRRERGEADRARTRGRILDAAAALFSEHGYAATTITQIARTAGVSVQTIYLAVGAKADVLRALTAARTTGGDSEAAVTDQAWVAEIAAETDPERQLRRLARESVALAHRAAPLWSIMAGAAQDDPALAEDLTRQSSGRLADQQAFARLLHGPLRDGMSTERAGDVLYALASPQLWNILALERGWSAEELEQFLGDALTRLLLPPSDPDPTP
ncbi:MULTISPECIES: TetR/AcrR family transcriptional regulator [unclassified Rathayibacter]|jgi:AcrR family transcriptional regulator|uniref:TetR/AcrR family transcriptional regulator n=1 Tax=unclassified Rathayibacter TaxID=2609250 RepID=UPI000CE92CD3|nr:MULTISPECIES: TetR/AcrR family transcriptional regulator [unclassified Rathayibacter]PPG51844.1 TetR family transcriptional regulator [Rathayibacter sp. AY2B3]PPI21174.1 TetR family transcriptional regulator [Rathayibacter sp. AY1B6]PPI24307.1 TetR family transcriptional regulator [Rathayibacter sp. AY1B5]PPI35066.1 TetR family transcriptional regulator [Rathayibacter sp. AY1B1]